MILNQTAVYALRAVAALAGLESGESLRSRDLADRTGVGVHYLSKVMRRLVDRGLVVGRKGPGGGFVLGRAPDQIRVAEVLAAADVHFGSGVCAFGSGTSCDPDQPCPLHPIWSRLQAFVEDWANETTMAETLVAPPEAAGERSPPALRSASGAVLPLESSE